MTFVILVSLVFASCNGQKGPPPAVAPEVSVIAITSEPINVTADFPGRINPVRTAEVRARATGILLRRTFLEGAEVKEGDLLFEIDPAPLKANLASAKATLAKALASKKRSRAEAARFRELVEIKAVSKAAYEQAIATEGQDEGEVRAAQAALETAELNLGYANVTAPISGRIGKALVTEGALVSSVEATPLAVIHQLEPVYFDFTQSSSDLLRLKRAFNEGKLESISPREASVDLTLEDGSTYSHVGKLVFSDVTVDETTGMVTLRAEVPNPDRILLPGMFARGKLQQAVNSSAITIPQRTLTRGVGGVATVLVVNAKNEVELRRVEVGSALGNKWIILKGLEVGERIVIEGSQKAAPGRVVSPVPWTETSDKPEDQQPQKG